MVRMSVLADCLKTISNAEKRGRRQVLIRPSSKVVIKFLQKMQEHGKLCLFVMLLLWDGFERIGDRERVVCLYGGLTAEIEDPVLSKLSLEHAFASDLFHTHEGTFSNSCCLCRMVCYIAIFIYITGYIGEFEIIDDHRSGKIVVELNGRINKCGVISPRFDVQVDEIEKWIVNLLPSRQFGHILISTTYGIMTHEEARRKKTGGKILGFFY